MTDDKRWECRQNTKNKGAFLDDPVLALDGVREDWISGASCCAKTWRATSPWASHKL